METIHKLDKTIIDLVEIKRKKPYLPTWWMFFSVLYKAKRCAEQKKETISLYKIDGYDMLYVPYERKFNISVDGVKFNLTLEQLVTAIQDERFLPSE